MSLRRLAFATALLLGIAVAPAFAQGPTQERIHFTMSVPFELKKSNIVLPPGDYLLFQIREKDRTLFGLYERDLTHAPIALISTIRFDYGAGNTPQKVKLLMGTDESSPQGHPVLEGWNIPGQDGFAMIAAVTRQRSVTARYQAMSRNQIVQRR